jgi:hypothetical protein
LLRATLLLDRAFGKFDRGRALLVTAFASDEVLAEYNDLAYGSAKTYDPGTTEFRDQLFNWEKDMIRRVFPRPPARVLVGGAGGGREAFQLAASGYRVTAFESSAGLARSMAARAAAQPGVEAMIGRYESLPLLAGLEGESIDLRSREPFDAALLGWSSFSHIRHAQPRISVLRAFADLTAGPVVVSFFNRASTPARRSRLRRALETLGRRVEGDQFTTHIGYYHLSSQEELSGEIASAGLRIVDASFDAEDGSWPWVAVARPQITAGVATGNAEPA